MARDFGIGRDGVAKTSAYSGRPGIGGRLPSNVRSLMLMYDRIDRRLDEDKDRPRKRRHTAKRIFERLRDECGFDGGYTVVKDHVRSKEARLA